MLGTCVPIHDSVVHIINRNGQEHKFLVVSQVGGSLPINRSLRLFCPNIEWEGSLLLFKMGQRAAFIGLTSSDRELANEALIKYVFSRTAFGVACSIQMLSDSSAPPTVNSHLLSSTYNDLFFSSLYCFNDLVYCLCLSIHILSTSPLFFKFLIQRYLLL